VLWTYLVSCLSSALFDGSIISCTDVTGYESEVPELEWLLACSKCSAFRPRSSNSKWDIMLEWFEHSIVNTKNLWLTD
jgi:hypothetical protein